MRNLRLLTMLLLTITAGFSSCEKGGDDKDESELEVELGAGISTPGGKTCLLTKTDESDSFYRLYEYDSKKRVVKIKEYDGNILEETITIAYGNSQIVVNGDETITYTVSNGVVNGGSVTDDNSVTTFTYEHNSEGYLTKRTEVTNYTGTSQSSTRVITYTYLNGNRATRQETAGSSTSTTTYEYDMNIKNTLLLDDLLLSKPNKNALKKRTETHFYLGQADRTTVDTYTYVVNSDNLITKSTKVEAYTQPGQTTQNTSYIENYQYTCN